MFSGVIDTLRDFNRSTRLVFAGMLGLGVIVFCISLASDIKNADWITLNTYTPSIVAGFTGFLVGVPVALVVFSTITGQPEEKAATDRVQALTCIAWNQFRDAVYELCSEERMDAMETCSKPIQTIHDQIFVAFVNYGTDPDRSEVGFRNMMHFLEHTNQRWAEVVIDAAKNVGNSVELQWMWIGVIRDWNTLDQYVRLQRLERNLPWLKRRYDTVIQQRMKVDSHPLREYFRLHEGPSPELNLWTNLSMLAAYRSIDALTSGLIGTHEELEKSIADRKGLFPNNRVDGYFAAVEQAQYEMRSLLYIVEEIDRELKWPKKFGQPEVQPN